jgi:hypothetical protein
MGVTGLMSWVRSCAATLEAPTDLDGGCILVDLSGLAYALVGRVRPLTGGEADSASAAISEGASVESESASKRIKRASSEAVSSLAGVDYAALFQTACDFVRTLQRHGVTAVYVMDGASDPHKARTHLRRASQSGASAKEAAALLDAVAVDASLGKMSPTAHLSVRYPLIDDVVACAAVVCGASVVRASYEADDVILDMCLGRAPSATGAAFRAVLTNDSDFLIASASPGMVPFGNLSIEDGALRAREYCRARFAAVIHVPESSLPILAVLAGNDNVDEGDWLHSALFEASHASVGSLPTELVRYCNPEAPSTAFASASRAISTSSTPVPARLKRKRPSKDMRGGATFNKHAVLEMAASLLRNVWTLAWSGAKTSGRSAREMALVGVSSVVASLFPTIRKRGRGLDRKAVASPGKRSATPVVSIDDSETGVEALECWLRAAEGTAGARTIARDLFRRMWRVYCSYEPLCVAEALPPAAAEELTATSELRSTHALRQQRTYRWPACPRVPDACPPQWVSRHIRAASAAALPSAEPCPVLLTELAGLESTVLAIRVSRGASEGIVATALRDLWDASSGEVPRRLVHTAARWIATLNEFEDFDWSTTSIDPRRVDAGAEVWIEASSDSSGAHKEALSSDVLSATTPSATASWSPPPKHFSLDTLPVPLDSLLDALSCRFGASPRAPAEVSGTPPLTMLHVSHLSSVLVCAVEALAMFLQVTEACALEAQHVVDALRLVQPSELVDVWTKP